MVKRLEEPLKDEDIDLKKLSFREIVDSMIFIKVNEAVRESEYKNRTGHNIDFETVQRDYQKPFDKLLDEFNRRVKTYRLHDPLPKDILYLFRG